jgi:molybdate transport system substrate-binding protein
MVRYDSVAALKRRIEAGDAFGVALLLKSAIDDLAAQGRVDGASATNLARAAVGVAVRAGAPLPDVSSVDALKQTLARARSYAYGVDSASGSYFQALLQRLEIPGAAEKLKAVPGGKVMQAVAQGEAELTVITVPNIIGEPGVALAGTLPEALQNYTIFSAAVAAPVSAAVAGGSAAQTFLAFLLTPESAGTFASHGLQRASP